MFGFMAGMRSSVQIPTTRNWVWSVLMSSVVVFCLLISVLAVLAMALGGDFSGGGAVFLFLAPVVMLYERTLLTYRAILTYLYTRSAAEVQGEVVDANLVATRVGKYWGFNRYYPIISIKLPSEDFFQRVFVMQENKEAYNLIGQSVLVRQSKNKKYVRIVRGENGQALVNLLSPRRSWKSQ